MTFRIDQGSMPAFPKFRCLVCVLIALGLSSVAGVHGGTAGDVPPNEYVEVGGERGIGPYRWSAAEISRIHGSFWGGGVAAADFDNDGDVDIFVPTDRGMADQLYRNRGDGQFDDIAGDAGVASMEGNRTALWFDYDGDRDLDLLVVNDESDLSSNKPTRASSYILYRQYENARFEDVTVEAGLFIPLGEPGLNFFGLQNLPSNRSGLCAGDINNDGYLDIFAPTWRSKNQLFLNNGDGTFSDISESSGIGVEWESTHQGIFLDVNRDGWLDLYETQDFEPNKLWINQQDLTFREAGQPTGLATQKNDMGVTVGNPDNDGDLDLYITGIYQIRPELNVNTHNVFLRNDSGENPGRFRYHEIAESVGVADTSWGWGTTFTDGDNDGWQDIAATNGYLGIVFNDRSAYFWNRGEGDLSFVNASESVNFWDKLWGSALLTFDYDRDGDLDLLQTTWNDQLRLLENRPREGESLGNYLVVKPRMNGPNYFAIGAMVTVEVGDLSMMRLIHAGTSYLAQEPAEAFFGLGDARRVDRVIVEWPDCTETIVPTVSANRVVVISTVPGEQPRSTQIDPDCLVDEPVPPFEYVNVSSERGIREYRMVGTGDNLNFGGGVAAVDYDGDGDVDLFAPNDVDVADQLYRNLGDGRFEEIASSVGLASLEGGRCALWFDYDGDSDLDLVVANDRLVDHPTTFRLYRQNRAGTFDDSTQEAGLFRPLPELRLPDGIALGGFEQNRGGMCAGDINNDGYLDLFAALWGGRSELFLNNRNGTFRDITESSGIGDRAFMAHQGGFFDFNRDGFVDLYVIYDFGPNQLWMNQGNSTFVNSASAVGVGTDINDMGLGIGDLDNDGDFDVYVSGIYSQDDGTANALLRNDSNFETGSLRFRERAAEWNVDYGGWAWGNTLTDADNDGWLDIVVTNGWFFNPSAIDPSLVYWNRLEEFGNFRLVNHAVGFDDRDYGSSVISFDMDRDGDMDLVQTTRVPELRLYENRARQGASHGNYLTVRPRMPGSNHFAIGGIVRIEVGGLSMMRHIAAGNGYLGQEPAEASFGIGSAESVEWVEVSWPGGSVTRLEDVAANQVLEVRRPEAGLQVPGDCNQDGYTDHSDVICVLVGLFFGDPASFPCGAATGEGHRNLLDWHGSGLVDISDALLMVSYLFLGTAPHRFAVPGEETTGCRRLEGCPSRDSGAGCQE
jgi:hypothetical protein